MHAPLRDRQNDCVTSNRAGKVPCHFSLRLDPRTFFPVQLRIIQLTFNDQNYYRTIVDCTNCYCDQCEGGHSRVIMISKVPRILTHLGLVFRGGRWIRCVRQRAPRRGTVPQSRQGRAKPLRPFIASDSAPQPLPPRSTASRVALFPREPRSHRDPSAGCSRSTLYRRSLWG